MGNEKWEMRKWGNGEMERQRTVGVKKKKRQQWCCHAGVRALATSGRAPPVQCIFHIVALLIANMALNGLEIEQRSIAMYNTELRVLYAHHTRVCRDLHFATVYGLRTDLGGCKISKFFGGEMPQTPL